MGLRPFGYLRDPVFRVAVAGYLLTLAVRLGWGVGGFVGAHANDLLCVAVCVPVLVTVTRRLNWRRHDGPPTGGEIALPVLVWAALFECVLPRLPTPGYRHVADPRDLLAYAAGALAAAIAWRWLYRSRRLRPGEEAEPASPRG